MYYWPIRRLFLPKLGKFIQRNLSKSLIRQSSRTKYFIFIDSIIIFHFYSISTLLLIYANCITPCFKLL